MSPEWWPRSRKEYLAWAVAAIVLRFSSLPADTAILAGVALYCLRVFLWPAVREQRRKEREELEENQPDE